MTTHSQISLECQPPVAISDPQPDTTPLNHLPGGSSTVTPNSNQTQEGVSSYQFACFGNELKCWYRRPGAFDIALAAKSLCPRRVQVSGIFAQEFGMKKL